jgi:hypothetical protein
VKTLKVELADYSIKVENLESQLNSLRSELEKKDHLIYEKN